jgi:hypothetical protein
LKVTATLRVLVKFTVQVCPDTASQPSQLPNVDTPVGAAVNVTAVPLGKLALHVVAHPSPAGELLTVPEPAPAKFTVSVGCPVVVVLKQTTLAVIKPVTMAPVESRLLVPLFVVTVAETRVFPQANPVAVINPVESTVTMSGVFEFQAT